MKRHVVLVLGAGGFVGKAVVEALARSDWATPVPAYHRLPASVDFTGFRAVDATDVTALAAALDGVDGLVNCVGGAPNVTLDTAAALFAAATGQRPAPRIVHLSSMSVYGSATGAVDEAAVLRADTGAYATAKLGAERIIGRYGNLVVLRPGCIYGPGSAQWSERIASLLLSGRIGDLGTSGEGFCNLVLVADVATAVLQALTLVGIEGQAFNLSATSRLTWNQYFALYADALGGAPLRQIGRLRLLADSQLLAPMLKLAGAMTRGGSQGRGASLPYFPPSLLRLFGQRIELIARKAETVLALDWTPLADGLAAAATAYQRRGGGA